MTFDWCDYLELAKSLRSAGDPASLRACVSRAYYAVFGVTRTFLESERGVPFTGEMIHASVLNEMDKAGHPKRMVFASNLRRLKNQRTRADYHADKPVDEKYADLALGEADKLMTDLTNLD